MKVFTDECCDATYLKGPKRTLEKYQLYPDSLIGYTAQVTYSALNEDFDYNNRSETTDTYLLNFQNEVIFREDEKDVLSQKLLPFPYEKVEEAEKRGSHQIFYKTVRLISGLLQFNVETN